MFQIRKITPGDVSFVMELVKNNNMFEGKLLENIEGFLVCENNRSLCGCGCLVTGNQKGYISWVAVSRSERGDSLGSAIVKALLNIAEHKGLKTVYAPGICPEFLLSLGFSETSCGSVKEELTQILGIYRDYKVFEVSLEGYFKPCSHK